MGGNEGFVMLVLMSSVLIEVLLQARDIHGGHFSVQMPTIRPSSTITIETDSFLGHNFTG